MSDLPARPPTVNVALIVMCASLVLGLGRTLLRPASSAPGLPSWFVPVVAVSTFAIMALLVLAIAFGRFWAVIVFAVMFVIGLPAMIAVLRLHPAGAASPAIAPVQTFAQAAALVLLFLPASRSWFRAARAKE